MVSYNMLANSLAFGAIPWVMIVPQTLLARASNWPVVKSALQSEYTTHWHKNLNVSPDAYKTFRLLWGESLVTSAPLDAVRLRCTCEAQWVEEDILQYTSGAGEPTRCVTMRGLLRKRLKALDGDHERLAEEIFEHVREATLNIFDWKVR